MTKAGGQAHGIAAEDVAARFVRRAALVDDLAALTDAFAEALAPHGFDHFYCALVASPGRPVDPKLLFGRPHMPSAESYVARKLAAHDPTIQHVFASAAAFTWSEVKQRPLTPQQWQVFTHAEAHGFLDGLVVPVHGADSDLWAAVLLARAPIRLAPCDRAAIAAAASLYAMTGGALAGVAKAAPAPSPLTRRESQCLAWASRGKSDWEIARILAIGDKTVNMHLDSARRKLGVPTRAQAALAAWKRGWLLDFPE